jgi:glutathione S-transferase
LGYGVEENRLAFGEHTGSDYVALNPYKQIPTVIVDDEILLESSAICITLAERHPEAGLIPSDPAARARFWQLLNLASTTLEQPVVNYILAQRGVADERWIELVGESTRSKLQAFVMQIPEQGYLAGEFSLADIFAAYVLRIGVQSGLIRFEGKLAKYLDRLRARPAAIESRFFDSLET